VMALLSECIGARGFEADTYFELALRDVPLVPILEGSTHINYEVVAQFLRSYFARRPNASERPASPPSLAALGSRAGENPYLLTSLTNDVARVRFPHFLQAYGPLRQVANVARFVRQIRRFRACMRRGVPLQDSLQDVEIAIALGKCLSIIVYGQLVAEHCVLADVPAEVVSVLFHQSIEDLSVEAMRLAALPQITPAGRVLLSRMADVPQTAQSELEHVCGMFARA
jgi:acyl-CoA dehydrogenase